MAQRPLGVHRLIEERRRGPGGVAYLGWDTRLNRHVQVHLLPRLGRGADEGPRLFEMFIAEMRQLTLLRHPNIDSPSDFATAQSDEAWYVTEHIEEITLRDFLDSGPPTWSDAALILHELAKGLAAAHGRGIVHGHPHPAAVLLDSSGRVVLSRFPVALTVLAKADVLGFEGAASVCEDLQYLSPEVIDNKQPSPASDMFSFGTTAYELLTGKTSFESPREIIAYGRSRDARPPDPWRHAGRVPDALRNLVRMLLSPRPAERPESMEEAARTLREILVSEGMRDVPAELRKAFARHPAFPEERPVRRTTDRMAAAAVAGVDAGSQPSKPATTRGRPGTGKAGAGAARQPAGRRKTERQVSPGSHERPDKPAARARPEGDGEDAPTTVGAGGRRVAELLESQGFSRKPVRRQITPGKLAAAVLAVLAAGFVVLYLFVLRSPGMLDAADRPTVDTPRIRSEEPPLPPEPTPPRADPRRRRVARAASESAAQKAVERAEAKVAATRPELAEAAAREGLEAGTDDGLTAHLTLAVALERQDKLKEAAEAYVAADRAAGPTVTVGHMAAVRIRMQRRLFEEALETLRATVARDASKPRVFRLMAECAMELERFDVARAALARFVRLEPDALEERLALASLEEQAGRHLAAQAQYEAVLERDRENRKALLGARRTALELGRKPTGVAAEQPLASDSKALALAAEEAFRAERFARAARLFGDAMAATEGQPPTALVYNYAVALDRAGRLGDAILAYRKVLEREPRDHELRFLLAGALTRERRTAEAVTEYVRVIESNPGHWRSYFEIGVLRMDGGHNDRAESAFAQVLTLNPGHAASLQNLARLQLQRNARASALETLRQLAAVRPDDAEPLLTAARLATNMQQTSMATELLAEACRRGAREACQP